MDIKFSKNSDKLDLCVIVFSVILVSITLAMTYIVITRRNINPLSNIPITTLQIIITVMIQNKLLLSDVPKLDCNTDNTKPKYKYKRTIIFISYVLSVICYIVDVIITHVFIDNAIIRFIYVLPCFIILLNLLYTCIGRDCINSVISSIGNTITKEVLFLLILLLGIILITVYKI